jgi:hypothetical protein
MTAPITRECSWDKEILVDADSVSAAGSRDLQITALSIRHSTEAALGFPFLGPVLVLVVSSVAAQTSRLPQDSIDCASFRKLPNGD